MAIYLIRAGKSGPVKIGIAVDVQRRFLALQAGNPDELQILRVIHGGRSEENWLHDRYQLLRIRGEWFRFVPEMLTIEPPNDQKPLALRKKGNKISSEINLECRSLVRAAAQPAAIGEPVNAQIERAASRLSFSKSRIKKWWYAEPYKIFATEYLQLLWEILALEKEDGVKRLNDEQRQTIEREQFLFDRSVAPPEYVGPIDGLDLDAAVRRVTSKRLQKLAALIAIEGAIDSEGLRNGLNPPG